MDNCIFCKIIKGEIPSYTIYEDDIVKCFLDINPVNDGHVLIIPKKHFDDFDDIDLETLNHIMGVAKDIKKRIMEVLKPDGVLLLQYGELVKHFHLHLIPFKDKDVSITSKSEKKIDVKEVFELLK